MTTCMQASGQHLRAQKCHVRQKQCSILQQHEKVCFSMLSNPGT